MGWKYDRTITGGVGDPAQNTESIYTGKRRTLGLQSYIGTKGRGSVTTLERRALMGDRHAQEECTEKGIMLPCPFCGGLSEIHEAEAIPEYATHKKDIPKSARFLRQVIYPAGQKYYEYRRKTFIPRCLETSCVGRIARQYKTIEKAMGAWNTRQAPPIGRCASCACWDENTCE